MTSAIHNAVTVACVFDNEIVSKSMSTYHGHAFLDSHSYLIWSKQSFSNAYHLVY